MHFLIALASLAHLERRRYTVWTCARVYFVVIISYVITQPLGSDTVVDKMSSDSNAAVKDCVDRIECALETAYLNMMETFAWTISYIDFQTF